MHALNDRWAQVRLNYKKKIFKTLNNIRDGTVSEEDLDKLNNFCAVALILMGKVQEPVWRKAERDAEIKAWLKGEIIDEADGLGRDDCPHSTNSTQT